MIVIVLLVNKFVFQFFSNAANLMIIIYKSNINSANYYFNSRYFTYKPEISKQFGFSQYKKDGRLRGQSVVLFNVVEPAESSLRPVNLTVRARLPIADANS
jgi:hypothetical protein